VKRGHVIQSSLGFVRLVDYCGTDERIAQAARVSTKKHREKKEFAKLVAYLFKNRHTSPFEQCSVTFEIKMPIFVMRQFVRHRTFKLNEASARYAEVDADYWIPDWRELRAQNTESNKQGSHSFGTSKTMWDRLDMVKRMLEVSEHAFASYRRLLEQGVAREQARVILPLNTFTTIMVTCDLHNLMHFLRLRLHPHAQAEIRELAEKMKTITKELFPVTMGLFDKYRLEMVEVNA
jgi:thymidylate synthase (FAD)